MISPRWSSDRASDFDRDPSSAMMAHVIDAIRPLRAYELLPPGADINGNYILDGT
jgi:hypothetical protein